MAEVSVERLGWHEWPRMAPAWERIHNMCPDASFFLSREWVDCWLATYGEVLNPDLLAFVKSGEVVGCCVLVRRIQRVRGIPLRRLYLNCAGENEADSTCLEYNSLLSVPDCAEAVAGALETFLRKRHWDELLLEGVAEGCPMSAVGSSLGAGETSARLSRYVDFGRVRNGAGFDSFLSPNCRHQIRRCRHLYEESGPCTFRIAHAPGEALEIFTRLMKLHQVSWEARGQPGVFASSLFTAFHQRLIGKAFDDGRILLAELSGGEETIGALYAFQFRRRVYLYQSGFCYTDDARLKPGLLTHYLTIRYCLEQPALDEYDFLAGDLQYKRSLATDCRELRWIVVRRPTVATLLYRGLRSVKRAYGKAIEKQEPCSDSSEKPRRKSTTTRA